MASRVFGIKIKSKNSLTLVLGEKSYSRRRRIG